ncbi:MAG: glycine cleavage system H protein [Thermodesulfobacteriota bacterium]
MDIEGYHIPEDRYYEEGHCWVKEENGTLVMGMDDFAQKLAGEIVYVQLPEIGKALVAGKRFAKVESGKWLGKINAPVTGELVGVNEELENNPGLINQDCYGKGWMFTIKPADIAGLARLIHTPDAIRKWMLADIEKFAKMS